MQLSQFQLAELCDIAVDAATKAGKLIASYINKEVAVTIKKEGNSLASQVLTEVDQKSQNLILEMLAPTLIAYDLGVLTEESEDDGSRFQKDYFWCIDPLDGTLAFTEKRAGFAVSIALVAKNGESVIGVIYEPTTELACWAIKEGGVFKTEKKVAPIENGEVFTLISDYSFERNTKKEVVISAFQDLVKEQDYGQLEVKKGGGSVMNAIWVLQHQPASYFKFPKKEKGGGCVWDYAATACVFNELGMYVSDMEGKPLNFNPKGSLYMNEKGVLYTTEPDLVPKFIASISME